MPFQIHSDATEAIFQSNKLIPTSISSTTNIAILATLKCLSILFLKTKYFVKQTQRCKTFVPAAVKAPLNPCHDM